MKTISTYGALKNDDVIFIQGYRFRVTNIRAIPGVYIDSYDVIRFDGVEIDGKLTGTGYAKAVYGANADVPCTIETSK